MRSSWGGRSNKEENPPLGTRLPPWCPDRPIAGNDERGGRRVIVKRGDRRPEGRSRVDPRGMGRDEVGNVVTEWRTRIGVTGGTRSNGDVGSNLPRHQRILKRGEAPRGGGGRFPRTKSTQRYASGILAPTVLSDRGRLSRHHSRSP